MRKWLIASILAIMAIPSYGQNIGFRRDNDKATVIATDYTIKANLGYLESINELGVSLTYTLNKVKQTEMFELGFIVYSRCAKFSIDQGSKLLIKTFSGSIIELRQEDDCHDIKTDKQFLPGRSTREFLVYPDYMIDRKSLETLMAEGIKEMRFQTTKGLLDYSWKKDVYGKLIQSEFDLILGKTDFGVDF